LSTPSFCAVIFIHGSTGLCVLSTWVRDRTIPEKKLRANFEVMLGLMWIPGRDFEESNASVADNDATIGNSDNNSDDDSDHGS